VAFTSAPLLLICFVRSSSLYCEECVCVTARHCTWITFATKQYGAGIAQAVWRLATGWTIRGSKPVGSEFFRTRPDQPWTPLSLLYGRYRIFSGGKVTGAWRWPPTPSSAEVKEGVDLYLCSPSGPSWPVLGQTLPLPLPLPLPSNTASETFLNKLGGVGSADWILLTGAPAWRWMANTTSDKTFYSPRS
jgi:hypothetical protein